MSKIKQEQKVVAVSGYFNPIHQGHISLFEQAKKLGDKLVVIINNDKQRKLKGSKEFMSEEERKYIIQAIRYVDEAVISVDEDKTVCKTLAMVKPHIFANGGDRKALDDIPEAAVCQEHDIEMIFNVGGGKIQSSSWLLAGKLAEKNPALEQTAQARAPRVTKNIEEIPNINQKKIIIADVDDTICDSCQVISKEMAEQINTMIAHGYEFAFISGTKLEDLKRMISSHVTQGHHMLATTGTNYTYVKGDMQEQHYSKAFSAQEKEEITKAFEILIEKFNIQSMTTKEDQLQDRESQITLSAIGRKAPLEIKKQYDPNGTKRQEWVAYLQSLLGEEKYDFKIGGTTSIDVTRKGLDKEWGIKTFAEHNNISLSHILFFGDKIYPGGNDHPASKIVDCIAVTSPKDTLAALRRLVG